MPRPLVSVLLPVRDEAPYLAEALTSLSKQSFEDFEVLVVDDGSTDDSAEIAAEHVRDDSRFRLLRGRRRGIVAALEVARAAARGSLLARMDGDDVAFPHRLAAQSQAWTAERACERWQPRRDAGTASISSPSHSTAAPLRTGPRLVTPSSHSRAPQATVPGTRTWPRRTCPAAGAGAAPRRTGPSLRHSLVTLSRASGDGAWHRDVAARDMSRGAAESEPAGLRSSGLWRCGQRALRIASIRSHLPIFDRPGMPSRFAIS